MLVFRGVLVLFFGKAVEAFFVILEEISTPAHHSIAGAFSGLLKISEGSTFFQAAK